MNDSKGRTWELKCLVVLYLIPAAAGLQRAVSSIQTWSFLGKLLPFSPLAQYLGFVPLPWQFWPLLAVTLICYVGLTQLIKSWMVKKNWI